MKVGLLLIYIVFLLYVATWNSVVAFMLAVGSVLLVKGNFKRLKGLVGEWRVRSLLSGLGDEYAVYHNVYVPRGDGRLTQVDHVIVSRYQIFVLETKNYAGAVYGEESDTYWTQALGQKERLFYNPILQNAGHVLALLHEVGVACEVQSVVVFSDQTRLQMNPYMESAKILSNRDLLAYITRFQRKVLTVGEVKRWNAVLQSLQKSKRRGRFGMWREHLRFVRGVQKRFEVKERAGKQANVDKVKGVHLCPKCGAKLVLRNGKYGEFYGCSGFPACRYSVDKRKV